MLRVLDFTYKTKKQNKIWFKGLGFHYHKQGDVLVTLHLQTFIMTQVDPHHMS